MQLHQFTSAAKTSSAHRDDGRDGQMLDLVNDGEGFR
jgi:hypothetical protein